MRIFSDKAIETTMESARDLYVKLANYRPDDQLDREDISGLMFILTHYEAELRAIKRDREKATRKAR